MTIRVRLGIQIFGEESRRRRKSVANSTNRNLPLHRAEAGEISVVHRTSKPLRPLQRSPQSGATTTKGQNQPISKPHANPFDAHIYTSRLLA